MITTMQQATDHNQHVLNYLTVLLSALGDAGAIIGRDKARVAINIHRTPIGIRNDPFIISDASRLFAGGVSGSMNVFSTIQSIDDFLLLDVRGLLHESDLNNSFPLLTEVRSLIEALPSISSEDALKVNSADDEVEQPEMLPRSIH